MVPFLSLFPDSQRPFVNQLKLTSDVMGSRVEGVLELLKGPAPPTTLISSLNHMVEWRKPELIPSLLPRMLELAAGSDAETAFWTVQGLAAWLRVKPLIAERELQTLIALLNSTQKPRIAGRTTMLSREVARSLIPVAAADQKASRALEDRLKDDSKPIREGAA